jgi:hypothetical protein
MNRHERRAAEKMKTLEVEVPANRKVVVVPVPLMISYEQEDGVYWRIYPPKGYTHEHYGIMVCDLVRHIANAFDVHEDDVWHWVDKERRSPTSPVTMIS